MGDNRRQFDLNAKHCFVHIIWGNELKFSTKYVKLVNDESLGFKKDEHVFVTPFENVYDALHDVENVFFHNTKNPRGGQLINEIAPCCDWLIIHDLCKPMEVRKIRREYFSKIVWRTWGNDAGYIYQQGEYLKNMVKAVLNMLTKKYYRFVFAVGYANKVDVVDIRQRFGEMPMFRMAYANANNYDLLSGIRNEAQSSGKKDDLLRVVIGHFGFKDDNHRQVIDLVAKYANENVRFYFPLSYGDPEYTAKLKKYAAKKLGNKAEFIEEFMPYEQYARFYSQIDICIMNGTRSCALGNISLAAFFGKKIYLHRSGVIKKAFDMENAPHMCVDSIKGMNFEEFAQPLIYSENDVAEFVVKPNIQMALKGWFDLLDSLREESQRRKSISDK